MDQIKKMKKTTCGIIIRNEFNELLMGHSTGNIHWDIPKGMREEGESNLNAAIRELDEEFGLQWKENDITYVGEYKYNKDKNIVLFERKVNKSDIIMDSLFCKSMVTKIKNRDPFPEMDDYMWIKDSEKEQYMSKVLFKLFNETLKK